MIRLRFTLSKELVADLNIRFRNWFSSAFQDLVNISSSAPPSMGVGGCISIVKFFQC